jgi:oligoendopeptidase F
VNEENTFESLKVCAIILHRLLKGEWVMSKETEILISEVREALKSMEGQKKLEKCFNDILNTRITDVEGLKNWLLTLGKIQDEAAEVLRRDYASFQCHNDNEEIKRRFTYDQEVISPLLQNYQDKFDKFLYSSEFRKDLGSDYDLLIKRKVNAIELFRSENISIGVEEDKLSTQYFDITGQMTVIWDGEEKTLPQMRKYLKDPDRNIREKAWKLIEERKLKDSKALDDIMNKLVKIRHQKALNAGLKNFRDYKFKELERFDYTPKDCLKFHEAILKYVVPLNEKIQKKHQEELGIKTFRPWDMGAVPCGQKPLKPFESVDELIDGVKNIFAIIFPMS